MRKVEWGSWETKYCAKIEREISEIRWLFSTPMYEKEVSVVKRNHDSKEMTTWSTDDATNKTMQWS